MYRYHNVDIKGVESGDYGEAEEVACQEDPSYAPHLAANRQRAAAAVEAYAAGKEVAEAAKLLYQVNKSSFQLTGLRCMMLQSSGF